MRLRTVAFGVLAAVSSFGVAACSDSGSAGNEPKDTKATVDLADDLQANGMRKKQAECVARAFQDAKLSPEQAAAVAAGKVDELDSTALKIYARSASTCLGVTVAVPGS